MELFQSFSSSRRNTKWLYAAFFACLQLAAMAQASQCGPDFEKLELGNFKLFSNLNLDTSTSVKIEGNVILDVDQVVIGGNLEIAPGARLFISGSLADSSSPTSQRVAEAITNPTKPAVSLKANNILVWGELRSGTEFCPVSRRIELVLTAAIDSPDIVQPDVTIGAHTTHGAGHNPRNFGKRCVAVGTGGKLELHGAKGLSESWSHLAATAKKGATSIQIIGTMSSWQAGDRIVIASTDFNMLQAEERTIKSVKPQQTTTLIEFDEALKYLHFGEDVHAMQIRAEVGLLSRSITITGQTDDVAKQNGFGSHVMIQEGFSAFHVEGVDFSFSGQKTFIARYPIHFHIAGHVPEGTYLKDSSIYRSNFRCVTIHGSHGVMVKGNVAYDHYGHCMFLEDGVEQDNVFDGNLVLVTREKEVSGPNTGTGNVGLRSDTEAPSSFWITNPNNVLINNAAAGSQDAGIWYLFRPGPSGISKMTGLYNDLKPNQVNIKLFMNNTVHSCRHGFMIEPTNHSPDNDGLAPSAKLPFFAYLPVDANGKFVTTKIQGLKLYKTIEKGAWTRGADFLFDNCYFADNRASLTIASSGTHPDIEDAMARAVDCTFIGDSGNKGTWDSNLDHQLKLYPNQPFNGEVNPETGATTPGGRSIPMRGFQFYDGPQLMERCHFFDFHQNRFAHHSAIGYFWFNTWQMASTNAIQSSTFTNCSSKLYFIPPIKDGSGKIIMETRLDGDTNSLIDDIDGCLTGTADRRVVSPYPHLYNKECTFEKDYNGYLCPQRYANLWVENMDPGRTQYGNVNPAFMHVGMRMLRHEGLSGLTEQQVRDDHVFDMLGATAANEKGQKYRYQPLAMVDKTYSIHWPHPSPPSLRVQLNNVAKDEFLDLAFCYPAGSSDFKLRRGLFIQRITQRIENARAKSTELKQVESKSDPAFATGDAYYFDGRMLWVKLQQRFDRQHWSYCPHDGCETLFIDATIPAGASQDSGACFTQAAAASSA